MKSSVSREYWPTKDWKEATPQDMGMNPSLLANMHETIEADIPTLHSLLIVRHGYLLFERYYQGYTRYDEHYLASASKSVISALNGKYHAFFASGFGGQLIYVIPALDLIVTTTASMGSAYNEHKQWKKIQSLIPRFVLPAIIEN
jgi:hypothetical protein